MAIKTNQLTLSQSRESRKRASSIPRPSVTPLVPRLHGGRVQDQSMSTTATPMRSQSAQRPTTPQKNNSTPQKSMLTVKPFGKEPRNFNDKNYLKEMMNNILNFLMDFGFTEQAVSIKDIHKIDKQSFVKFFNFICQFVDRNFQLAARFNEDELVKFVRSIGYGGTLTKAALVSIGALHSTSQITGLLSWLVDQAAVLMCADVEEDNSNRQTLMDRQETDLGIAAYNAWIAEEDFAYESELMFLYERMFQIEDGAVEEIQHQITVLVDEYKVLEQRGSQMEDLKLENKRLEQEIEEVQTKKVEIHQFLQELQGMKLFDQQKLEELKQKTAVRQNETAALREAAKNCKLSAAEARKMKADCAHLRKEMSTVAEQRTELAELFEKRELQKAKVSAEDVKITRKLYVDLMDMGIALADDSDWEAELENLLREKNKELPQKEARILSIIENKEKLSNSKSHLTMELKHIDLQKQRLDSELQDSKIEREEMNQIFLNEQADLENGLTSCSTRADPAHMRLQLELDTVNKQVRETDVLMLNAEQTIKKKMRRQKQDLEELQFDLKATREKAAAYYAKLFTGVGERLRAAENGALCLADAKKEPILPKPDF